MTGLKELTQSINVPSSTGVDGFLHALREIIKKPRIQKVTIEATGKVVYTSLASDSEEAEEESQNYGVDFGHLEPYAVIRNSDTRELSYPNNLGACDVIAVMFDAVSTNGFTPICFATGINSHLWNWCHFTSGIEIQSQEMLCGYPIYTDRQLPDTALVLCAGVGQTKALIDTRLSVKVEMRQNPILNDEMEIL